MVQAANTQKHSSWWAFCLATCVAATTLKPCPASAEGPRLLVLRNDVVSTELNAAVDRELVRALGEDARFESSYFSPTPFADIELAAGCDGSTDACIEQVAKTLNAPHLLVREIRRDESGSLVLSLTAQDGADAPIRRSMGFLSPHNSSAPDRVVPRLVGDLYGSDAVATRESVAQGSPHTGGRGVTIAGWGSLASSGVLLATGVALATVGHKDHDRYAKTDVYDVNSAERADHLLDDARRRVRIANGLFATGAVLGATGVGLLIWDHLRDKRDADQRRLALDVQGGPGAGFVTVSGVLGSGLP